MQELETSYCLPVRPFQPGKSYKTMVNILLLTLLGLFLPL